MRLGLLLACLVAVVGLTKKLSPTIEHALEAANAPRTVVGILIATQGKPDTPTYCCLHHRPGLRL
jgi:Ca2+/H+ antiporter